MDIIKSTFVAIPEDAFGIVILGCDVSTQENRDGFVEGVTNVLIEEKVIPEGAKPEDVWGSVLNTTTTGGRNDLIFVAKDSPKVHSLFNMSRFVVARLKMPDCTWIEDWLVNYAEHYGCEPRGPHARHVDDSHDEEDEE